MNKLKVLIGSLLILATMLFSSYALAIPLPHPFCVTMLQAAPTQATTGQMVTLDASSSACFMSGSNLQVPITSYLFTFGDGYSTISSSPVVTHAYAFAGSYSPAVGITLQGWQSIATSSVNIVSATPVQLPPQQIPPAIGFFRGVPNSGVAPLAVTFWGSAAGTGPLAYTLYYDITDRSKNATGVIDQTDSALGTYTYLFSGAFGKTYTAELAVSDYQTTTSKRTTVQVSPSWITDKAPIVDFTYSPANVLASDQVNFTDLSYDSDGNVTAWLWSFGDGTTSRAQNATHTYSKAGTYTVSLTAYDNTGMQNSTTKTLMVNVNPYNLVINTFTADPNSGTESISTNFNVDFTGLTPVNYTLFYNTNDLSLNVSGELSQTNVSLGNYNYTIGDYVAELMLSNQYANAMATAAIHVASVTPPAPGSGVPLGGGGSGMYLSQPTPLIKNNGTTYLFFHPSFALNGTRYYSYDPASNTTTIVFTLVNLANFNRTLSIRDLIPKDMAASMTDVQIIPVPTNIYNADPDIGWNVTLAAQQAFTTKYIFSKYVPFASFDAMGLPTVTELKPVGGVPTEVPVSPTTKVTVPGGITGFVVTTLSNPWAGVVIVIVILVLFFTSTDTGRETWGKISAGTGNFISSIAEELEEPKDYKQEKGDRVKKLKKLMKKKKR